MDKYHGRTELPKMHRVVYAHLEWLTDKCVNGEHEQDCGTDYVKVMRVLEDGLGWKWLIVDKDIDLDCYQLEALEFANEVGETMISWSPKDPDGFTFYPEKDNRSIKQKRIDNASY